MGRRWATFLGPVLSCGLAACGGDDGDGRAGHGYVAFRATASGDTLYLSGAFREPSNDAGGQLLGHAMMVVLDGSDPAAPLFLSELDMKLTRVFGVLDGKLLAVQDGADEEMLDLDVGPPAQPVRLKVFDLGSPEEPSLERTIELPGGELATPGAWVLDDEQVLVTVGDGDEDESVPLTWIVRPGAAAGSEVVGSANVGCRAFALDGTTLWCVSALGLGTGRVVGFTLAADGSLTEIGRATIATLIQPRGAAVPEPGGSLVIGDAQGGVFSMGRDVDDLPSIVADDADLDGAEAAVIALSTTRVIVQTSEAVHVLDPSTLDEVSSLPTPGTPDDGHIGGSSLVRLDGGAALDGLFAASLGDFGVVLLREDAGSFEQIGGYYRHFGENLATRDTLQEGNY